MNQAKLQLLCARAYHDLAAAQSAALVALGSRLGLYDALSAAPRTASELALASGVAERYLLKRPISLVMTFAAGHLSTFYWEKYWMQAGRRFIEARRARLAEASA